MDCLREAKDVKLLNPDLFLFSEWIIRNRDKYEETEFQTKAQAVGAPLSQNLSKVWNNLFYQFITMNSFNVKEALMQMLLADHIVRNLKRDVNESAYNNLLVNAHVILPAFLFDESNRLNNLLNDNSSVVSNVPPSHYMRKKLTIAKAKFSNVKLKNLKKELEVLERTYRKEFQEEYETAYSAHQSAIKPLLDNYRNEVENEKNRFCSISYDPTIPFNKEDPCQQPNSVPFPRLPEFEFNFRKEIDPEELELNLSKDSYAMLLDISGFQFVNSENQYSPHRNMSSQSELIKVYESYNSIVENIDKNILDNDNEIIKNQTPDVKQVSIGGVVTPVNTNSINIPLYKYSICGTQLNQSLIFTLSIGVPENLSVSTIEVKQINSDESIEIFTINNPTSSRNNYSLVLDSFYSYTFQGIVIADGPTFEFNIKLFDENDISKMVEYKFTGIDSMRLLDFCQRGTMELVGETTLPDETHPFIPSGFGLKMVGVADYLKVEQSIHCYVESEVSHIENIMAREYKEKATRKLRRSENTITTSTETEKEQLSDTTSTDRFEMQTEVNKVIQESKDLAGNVNSGYQNSGFFINAGVSFSNSSSSEDSIRQAVTEAQEITSRAMDRVVSKVKEERVLKIIEEFEENNKHGFDNREGNEHVVGVYRWIDKLYKNQIYNYGKRMMFEFMIPDPAKLHNLGFDSAQNAIEITDLTPPLDPREAKGTQKLTSYLDLNETNAAYWAGVYNAEINAKPISKITVGDSYHITHVGGGKLANVEANSGSGKITIPEGYKAVKAWGIFNAISDGVGGHALLSLTIGNRTKSFEATFGSYVLSFNTDTIILGNSNHIFSNADFGNEVPVSYTLGNHVSGDISVSIECVLTSSAENQWKQETFKAIMDAYNEALAVYKSKYEAEKNKAVEIKRTNPGFYRQIENLILRKNCISYMISQNPLAQYTYGKDLSNKATSFSTYEIKLSSELDNYSSFVKFIEQAFEWDIMSYNFYPFYWGPKNGWVKKYQFDDTDDPTFRAFIQAGMARVILTVKPGFEKAVQLYFMTGQIWNGGQVPVIGDGLYEDIIAEIENAKVEPQGKPWITRVPTSLTILQAKSIGLEVESALPCNCDDDVVFENPEEALCGDSFEENDFKIGGETGVEVPTPSI